MAGQCLPAIVSINSFPFHWSHSRNVTQLFLLQHRREDRMLIRLFQELRKPWRVSIAQGKSIGVPALRSGSAWQLPTPLLCEHVTDSANATNSVTRPLSQSMTKIYQEQKEQDQQKQAPARRVVLGIGGGRRVAKLPRSKDSSCWVMSAEGPPWRLCVGSGVCRQCLLACYISSCTQAALCSENPWLLCPIRSLPRMEGSIETSKTPHGSMVVAVGTRIIAAVKVEANSSRLGRDTMTTTWGQSFLILACRHKLLSPSIRQQHRYREPWTVCSTALIAHRSTYICRDYPMPIHSHTSASCGTNEATSTWVTPVLSLHAWIPAPMEETCKSFPAHADIFYSLQTPVSQQEISAEWATPPMFKSFDE